MMKARLGVACLGVATSLLFAACGNGPPPGEGGGGGAGGGGAHVGSKVSGQAGGAGGGREQEGGVLGDVAGYAVDDAVRRVGFDERAQAQGVGAPGGEGGGEAAGLELVETRSQGGEQGGEGFRPLHAAAEE